MRKNILAVLCLVSIISLISCSVDEEQIIEELSFAVNGKSVSYSNPNAGLNIFDELVVSGETAGSDESIAIMLLNNSSGTFTQDDIDDTQSVLASNYDIEYRDEGDNSYHYTELEANSSFSITVGEFSKDEGGLVTGTFSGVLYGSIFNGSAVPDSVIISNGKFKVKRADSSLENIY